MPKYLTAIGVHLGALVVLVLVAIAPYNYNISSIIRINQQTAITHDMPRGLVVLDGTAGYDGQAYYQMARDVPAFFSGTQNSELTAQSAYRWGRPLFSVLTWALSAGQESAFPAVMVIITILSILGSFALLLWTFQSTSVHILTIIYNPASLVGMLYAITEPLSVLCMTAFLCLFYRVQKITWLGIILLSAGALAREMTLVLAGCFFLVLLYKKRFKECGMLMVVPLVFALWMAIVTWQLGTFPTNGSNMFALPLQGIVYLLLDVISMRPTTLAAVGLFVLFFLPLLAIAVRSVFKTKWWLDEVHTALLGSLAVLVCMDPHIWTSVTSVGRVVTPIFPLYVFFALKHDSKLLRIVSMGLIVISVAAAVGMILTAHPFSVR